ncbi:hypothetical protein K492DRAFT_21157 [Lichtheimia hyalospora FSU 10163]|nr:hypothetical protein K492DRAFT_21157 [Lichtheimia hyalospora FSU 10163]
MEIEMVQAKNAVEQPGKGKSIQSTIVASTCTHTSDIRIWKASAWLCYYWLHVKDVIVSICIA